SCNASVPPPSFDVGCGTWTLEQPLPQAHALTSVWAAASDDVWAVGVSGAIVHWNGTSWTPLKSPTTANLYSVWGADAKHVWAGGVGVLLFFDGVAWSVDPAITQNINLITGSARDEVWVRTEQSLFHWDGARWTQPGSAVGAPNQWGFPIWPVGGGRAWAG